jgi:hypothetical protein
MQAVERHKDDWDRIGADLGISASSALWKFLQLPSTEMLNPTLCIPSRIPVDSVPSSFADVSNPLISQVYLAAKSIPSLPSQLPPSSRQFDDAAVTDQITRIHSRLIEIISTRKQIEAQREYLNRAKVEMLAKRSSLARSIGRQDLQPDGLLTILKQK